LITARLIGHTPHVSSPAEIGAAVQRLIAAYDRLGAIRRRTLGLNTNEEAVLILMGQGVCAPAELSRAIGMTTAGMTNLLDRLEADGLIRREPHQQDKRRILLTLTKAGFRAHVELEATNLEVGGLLEAADDAAGVVHRFLHDAASLVELRTRAVATGT
jgi:DNA-binding MarR family transcriptional regulator